MHAIHAANAGATELKNYSPDTDVFILALNKYPILPKDTRVVTGHASKRRSVSLSPIYEELGRLRSDSLLGFHVLSGADVTGSFSRKGKISFWYAFLAADDVLIDLSNLGKRETVDKETSAAVERFICQVHVPKTEIKEIGELRWWFFTRKQFGTEFIPPTQTSLEPAILRAHLQAMEWNRCDLPDPNLPHKQILVGLKRTIDGSQSCAPTHLLLLMCSN